MILRTRMPADSHAVAVCADLMTDHMKHLRLALGVLAVSAALAVGSGSLCAQSQPQEDQTQTRKGEVLQTGAQDGSLSGPAANRPELPETMPEAIRERLRVFEQKREEYLAKQLELARQFRGATDAERTELRERLREQRQAWLEEAKKIREQARVRLQEMKQELANHGEVIDAAREKVREQVRERRGTD